jgi:hypothetical protein
MRDTFCFRKLQRPTSKIGTFFIIVRPVTPLNFANRREDKIVMFNRDFYSQKKEMKHEKGR